MVGGSIPPLATTRATPEAIPRNPQRGSLPASDPASVVRAMKRKIRPAFGRPNASVTKMGPTFVTNSLPGQRNDPGTG